MGGPSFVLILKEEAVKNDDVGGLAGHFGIRIGWGTRLLKVGLRREFPILKGVFSCNQKGF